MKAKSLIRSLFQSLLPVAVCLAVCLSLPWTARAQPQGETYPFSRFRIQAPLLPIPTNAVASYAGAPGGSTWSYWVYAVYTGGASGLSNRATVVSVGTIAGGTPVQVAWAAQAGATSYVVLKTPNQTQPTAGCACVLASGLTVPRATDTGGALTNWTQPTQPPTTFGNFILDQRDFATPTWVFTPPLETTSGNTVVTVDGTGETTGNGEIVFLGAAGLEGTANYLYDSTTNVVTQILPNGANFSGYEMRSYAGGVSSLLFGLANGTPAAPTYPVAGDPLGLIAFEGWNENTGAFQLGAGIIVDAGSNWSPTNNDAIMDFHINENGTVGAGITILTLQPASMGVGVGYDINSLSGGLDGDLHIADGRAVTGDTEVIIQAGAGQAAAFLQIQNNAGTGIASIDVTGGFRPVSLLFAALGTPADGVMVYCSDCDAATAPCTSTPGTGAFAFRQGGAWSCQ